MLAPTLQAGCGVARVVTLVTGLGLLTVKFGIVTVSGHYSFTGLVSEQKQGHGSNAHDKFPPFNLRKSTATRDGAE